MISAPSPGNIMLESFISRRFLVSARVGIDFSLPGFCEFILQSFNFQASLCKLLFLSGRHFDRGGCVSKAESAHKGQDLTWRRAIPRHRHQHNLEKVGTGLVLGVA